MYRFGNEPTLHAMHTGPRRGRTYGRRTMVGHRAPSERAKSSWLRTLLLWLVLLVASSCGGPPSVEGTWSGTASGADGESGTLTLDLEQEGERVTGGYGELREDESSGGQAALLSVEGGSVGDDGSVTVLAVQRGNDLPIRINGEVSGDALKATFAVEGNEFPVSLERGGVTGTPDGALVPDASGDWAGTATDETGDETGLEFSLEQDGTALSGNGVLVAGGDRVPFGPVAGSVDGAGAVEFAYRPGAWEEGFLGFSGTLEGDSISGESTLVMPGSSGELETRRATFFLDRVSPP